MPQFPFTLYPNKLHEQTPSASLQTPELYESPLAYNLQKPFEFCILRGSFTNSEILMC